MAKAVPLTIASVLPRLGAALALGLATAPVAALPVPVHQAVPNVPAVDSPMAAQVADAPAGDSAADDSDGVSAQRPFAEIDWLLDLQVEKISLGATPADPEGAAQMVAAADLQLLTADLPTNPLFPGYGLSFVLPSGPVRLPISEGRLEAITAGAEGPVRSNAAVDRAERRDGRLDPAFAARLGPVREWVAAHRVELLIGLGVSAVLLALLGARSSKVDAPPPRRRRRRRRHGSEASGAQSSTAQT